MNLEIILIKATRSRWDKKNPDHDFVIGGGYRLTTLTEIIRTNYNHRPYHPYSHGFVKLAAKRNGQNGYLDY
ncbi:MULTISPECIES: hypothetical protein [Microcystis]|uniref:Uncharacterized protein n=1 Tax=Microcystis wesenbergii NRERC-220 TaxID=3068991 RepID=A0ABU3HHG6_9CHRO|nr:MULTISPECIES: hypothetical protein [Microcystis]MBD2117017.1 hypothetical protein [Microcystis wesenbergii FACHB-1339]MCZ8037440.1 hypothetical protein [Microcystis sp. LE17-20A]MCZ8212656.1 hypothetical protein [Microcystis sp. LE19-8.1F]MDT3673981.1 hypothetical protein [Microcystis wesenbergii NRERC-220]